jgi:Tfp pilus assembly protein PilE
MSTPPTWPPPPPSSPPPGQHGYPGGSPYGQTPPPKKSSGIPIVVIVIVLFFGGIFVLGIIAAIAIPAFLRARISANEASAQAAMRTMASAQVAWLTSHGGRYAQPSCLGEPASCGDTQASRFLDAEIASLGTRNGYEFGFVLRPGDADATGGEGAAAGSSESAGTAEGPTDAEVRAELEKFSTPDTGGTAAQPNAPPAVPSPRGRRRAQTFDQGGFAYWASPVTPGSTGIRRFCVDETGAVRQYRPDVTWTPPSEADPRCPDGGGLID